MNIINVTLSGGEPLLHKDFVRFLSRCRELDLSVNVLTNLTLLTDEILEEMKKNPLLSVQTSIYSMNSEVHDTITKVKGSFEKTKNNLLRLKECGIPLQISCPIMKENQDSFINVVEWAKENAKSSGLEDAPIRWLVDDCQKFVEREIRRGNHYDAIIMDPPSYGRGPKGEIWKIEDMIHPLIKLCTKILSKDALFFLVNSYTTGLAPAVLTYMIGTELKPWNGHVESQEIGLPVKNTGLVLPCGASGRWQRD